MSMLAKISSKLSRSKSKEKKISRLWSMPLCSDPNFKTKFEITSTKHPRKETYEMDRVSASCYVCIDELPLRDLQPISSKNGLKKSFVSTDPKCPNMRTIIPNGDKYAFKPSPMVGDGGEPFITLFQQKHHDKTIRSMSTVLSAPKGTCPKTQEFGVCFYSFDKTETEIAINGYLEEKEEEKRSISESPPLSHVHARPLVAPKLSISKTGITKAQPLTLKGATTKTATKTHTVPKLIKGVASPDWSQMGGMTKKTGKANFVDAGDVLSDYGFYERGNGGFTDWQELNYNHPNQQLVSTQDVGNEYYDILLLNVCIGLILILTICCIFNMISFLCGAGTGSLLSKKLNKLSRKIHHYDRINETNEANEADPNQHSV